MNRPQRKKPPLTEEEIAARAKSKQLARKMVITLCVAFVILIGLQVLSEIDFQPMLDAIVGKEESKIQFELADFEEDIMQDPAYLDKQRLMAYKNGAQMTLINEADYDQYDPPINMLHDYFTAAIAGDLHAYNACFTEAYHEANKGARTEPFTMQRIYDMMVEYLGEIEEGEDGYRKRCYYRVEYKIQKNNGTFRDDVGSDGALAQVFELVWNTDTKECAIDRIVLLGAFEGIPYGE